MVTPLSITETHDVLRILIDERETNELNRQITILHEYEDTETNRPDIPDIKPEYQKKPQPITRYKSVIQDVITKRPVVEKPK